MFDFLQANWQTLVMAGGGAALVVAFLVTKRRVVNPIQENVLEEASAADITAAALTAPAATTGMVLAKKVPPGTQITPAIVAFVLTVAVAAAAIYFRPQTDDDLRTERDTAKTEMTKAKEAKVTTDGKVTALEKQLKEAKITPVTDTSSPGSKPTPPAPVVSVKKAKGWKPATASEALQYLKTTADKVDKAMGPAWPRLAATAFVDPDEPFSITLNSALMGQKEREKWRTDVETGLIEILDAPSELKVLKVYQVTPISRDDETIVRYRVIYDAELPAKGSDPKQVFSRVVVALEPEPTSPLITGDGVKDWATRLASRFEDLLDPAGKAVTPSWVPTTGTIPGVGALLPAPGFGKKK